MSVESMLDDSTYLGRRESANIREQVGYTDPPTHISTFSGIGGFDLGFDSAGVETLVGIESDEHAAETYRRNLIDGDHLQQDEPPTLIEGDITDVSTKEILDAAGVGVGGVTAISGGPPCQGFSHLGPRNPDDERNELYLELARIVHQVKPVTFVMENVKGLANMRGGDAIREVCETFAAGGYQVTWDILNALDFGVPQHRERVFVMGKRMDVLGFPARGPPQLHIGAKPGPIDHPEFFRERHGLVEPDQTTFDAFDDDPETVEKLVGRAIRGELA